MHRCLTATLFLAFTLPASAQVVERWVNRYNAPAPSAVAVDSRGDIVVTGSSNLGFASVQNYHTAKYAKNNGALIWEKFYSGPGGFWNSATAVALDAGGNVVVTGYSDSSPNAFDYYTAKHAASDGALIWEMRYNGYPLGGADDVPSAVAVDREGNVIVTGYSDKPPFARDYYTVKYAAENGSALWERRHSGDYGDEAHALSLDGQGNVIVTGYSHGSGSKNFYTVKYAAADGVVLWQKTYDGEAHRDDEAYAVAVDGSGNVAVTGYCSELGSFGSGNDYYTAKYAAVDGALLWEKRYNGPGNNDDTAKGVVIDGNGNVIVTGRSSGSGSGSDYYTAKYAAADGALLWERRYNGMANGGEEVNAIAMDGSGNVVVTGFSWGGFVAEDWYTAKYAAADGAVLWEKRYNGPANGQDRPHALALTPEGGAVVAGRSFCPNEPDLVTIYYAPLTALQSWRQQYFDTADGTGNAADIADPDKDGLPNLIEWGCQFDPTVPSPPPVIPARDGPDFTFLYPRSTAAVTAGALFTVEWSDTLSPGDWHTDNVGETVLTNSGTLQQVQATIPAATGKRFARLRVTAPP